MKRAVLHGLVTCVLAVIHPAFSIAKCSLTKVVPHAGKISFGPTTVSLGDADSASHPTAWQGPLRTAECSFDIGIIEQPIAFTPSGQLYVATYSGSQRNIALYDLKACTIRWQSQAFEGKLTLNSAALQMGGTTLTLDDECVPRHRAKRP